MDQRFVSAFVELNDDDLMGVLGGAGGAVGAIAGAVNAMGANAGDRTPNLPASVCPPGTSPYQTRIDGPLGFSYQSTGCRSDQQSDASDYVGGNQFASNDYGDGGGDNGGDFSGGGDDVG